jgi:galactokinase
LSETFATRFGKPPTVSTSAPGRINLIGEHVDYNGGSVLPIATPQRAFVELGPRKDDRVRVFSVERGEGEYFLGHEVPGRGWLDYVQGVTRVLHERGDRRGGFEVWIHSEVPVGAGLSSSAALEVALLRGLRELWGLTLGDLELAMLGQRVENSFVGANVGIMDQMAASLADQSAALLLDTASLQYRTVQLPQQLQLLVIDSGIKHDLVTGDYNLRRKECEQAATALGVNLLCTLGSADLPRLVTLGEPLFRRARHAITENERVHAAVRAIEVGAVEELGRLINASHDSLRDDFEVSLPAIDRLVEIARAQPGVLGARLTGGGFGGAIVVLSLAKEPLQQAQEIAQRYASATQEVPKVVVPLGA